MRVAIDTNVIVSAFLSPSGVPAQLLAYLEAEAYVLLVSGPILAEYGRALQYPKVRTLHGMRDDEIAGVLDVLRAVAVLVESGERLDVVKEDRDDNKFFECGVAGGASYLVSGDAKVQAVGLYQGIRVVAPALFLEILDQDLG